MSNYISLLIILFSFLCSCNINKERIATKIFEEDTVSVLKNPCMGWGVYDDANDAVQNADKYWQIQDKTAREYASFFYVRWRWSEMEPEEGKYAWMYDENYKKLIKGALDRGLKLCFRIYNNSQDNINQSTPDYVRKAGAKGYMVKGGGKSLWTPYPDDPFFLSKLEKFVEAFAKEYDNPDIVDFVDAYNIGWWGECHNIHLQNKDDKALENLLDRISTIYSSNFKHVMLVLPFGSQVGFETEKRIAIDKKGYSMRRDGLGSMWFSDTEQAITQKMYGKTLFIGESCWWGSCSDSVKPFSTDKKYVLKNWRDVYELTLKHALSGHFNTLDLREISETKGWTTRANDLVDIFCRKGGYRIHPISVSYPKTFLKDDSVTIYHSWVNTGNGYLPNNVRNWNYKYKPAFALLDKAGNVVNIFVDAKAEPSSWLVSQEHSYLFKIGTADLKKGSYILALSIVDKNKKCIPAIKLALDKVEQANGWYIIGNIKVR